MRQTRPGKFRLAARGLGAAGLLTAAFLATACADSGEGGEDRSTVDAGATETASAPADLAPVDGAAIYQAASPAIPRVTSAAGTSAGLLVEGGFVFTAASVVTTGGPVSVAFPDGTVLRDVPVAAVDVGTDIGVLGPVESAITPAPLVDSDSVAPGTELFALGYGTAGDSPAIARVLLASAFNWTPGALRFLQLDDPGVGLEGMVVVLDRSGRTFALQNRGTGGRLAVSATEVNARAGALLEAGDASARVLDGSAPRPVQELSLSAVARQALLSFQAVQGSPTTIVVESEAAVSVVVLDAAGEAQARAESTPGEQSAITLPPAAGGPRLALVELVDPTAVAEPVGVKVSADVDLSLFVDPDDGTVLKAGDSIEGALDFPGDRDVLLLDLVAGQTVTIVASSPRVDPLLEVQPLGDDPGLVDDDSGRGAFGTDALIQLKASTPGTHTLMLSDSLLEATGGYAVSVLGATSDADLAATIEQIEGLAGSVMSDPRGEAALRELLSGILPTEEPVLPAAYGAAWRGTSDAGRLVTSVATTDTVEGEGSARTVEDSDGRFTVRATILARGQALAVPLVVNSGGEPVATGANATLEVRCAPEAACLAAVSLVVNDAAGLGPWTVRLAPVSGDIEAWQLEVLSEGAPAGDPTLPVAR